MEKPGESLNFTMTNSWNGEVPLGNETFHFKLFIQSSPEVLVIEVDAPFFNDPVAPPNPQGSTPHLWDYEVFELFFLGSDDKYLEIELGPNGHYLLLQFQGYRNLLKEGLPLEQFVTEIRDNRWCGRALIPLIYFPPHVHSFNAYAIHKSESERSYMALFPAEMEKESSPDFHRLKYFKPINLPGLCDNEHFPLQGHSSK